MQCSCGHNHIQVNAGKSPEPMALRLDPTRTTTLRQKMLSDVTRRFKALVQEINKIVIDDDCFGLVQTGHQLQFNAENQFKFTRSADKVKGFMDWLDEMQAQKILTVVTKPGRIGSAVDQAWTDVYIDSAYQQGIRRAGQEMKKGGMDIPIPAGMPGRDPVALAFSSPTHADRVGLIYTRVFNELKGITNAMDQQISSILAQGLAEGRNPQQIASLIKGRVEGIGLARARTLARTEIVRAHHMASIQEYRNAGLVGVSVKSEWLTAGFNVCKKCLELAKGGDIGNGIYSLNKIEGMIPAHPSCRCCALPYMEGVSPEPKQDGSALNEPKGNGKELWHGTPNKWEPEPGFPNGKPRLDYITTGEGNTLNEGWGFYLTETKKVGETYSRMLPSGGVLHKFNISKSVENRLLQFDKRLEEQSDEVRASLLKIYGEKRYNKYLRQNKTGESIFNDIVMERTPNDIIRPDLWEEDNVVAKTLNISDGDNFYRFKKAAAKYLSENGIVGNKYPDKWTLDGKSNSYNYVISDQNTLDKMIKSHEIITINLTIYSSFIQNLCNNNVNGEQQ